MLRLMSAPPLRGDFLCKKLILAHQIIPYDEQPKLLLRLKPLNLNLTPEFIQRSAEQAQTLGENIVLSMARKDMASHKELPLAYVKARI